MHRATKLSIIIVVVAVAVIIISYCLKFVCLQFSSAEFIYALGEEEKKPMYAICTTPSLRSFLNVAFKTVSMFVFSRKIVEQKTPFPERTEKGSSFRFPFNRMLTVNKKIVTKTTYLNQKQIDVDRCSSSASHFLTV